MNTETLALALPLAQLRESFQEAAASAEQRAAAELRRLHAENQQLRADLEAVGAGGVGPLIPTTVQPQAADHDAQEQCRTALQAIEKLNAELGKVSEQRDLVLSELKLIVQWDDCGLALTESMIGSARKAIASVEGGAA